jgi:alpha-1,3-rhamnosyl/mannosyltransferase
VVTTLAARAADGIAARAHIDRNKLVVVPPGPSSVPALRLQRPRARMRLVYVGNNRPHKRVSLLLRAFARVHAARPQAELVIVQRPEPRFPLDLGTAAGVRWVTDADDAEAASLLASARALAFPSVGEGFGFPVLEAFALDVPVVVADAAALPEVCAGGGMVVPADDESALAQALIRILDDDALHAQLVAGARAAVASRSWTMAADALCGAWQTALRSRHDGPWASAH